MRIHFGLDVGLQLYEMFPNSRSVEDKVDPVVATLTPSQKRQIAELYGGGNPQPGGKWEPVPILTPEQIKLVMAEQNSQYPRSSHDYRTTQAGMYHQQPPPFMGPSASNVPTGTSHHSQSSSQYYQGPSPHPPPVAHSAYPPPPHYQQGPSYPSVSHPQAGGHRVAAESRDLSSNLFSFSSSDNRSIATDNDYSIMVIGVTGSGKSTACNFFLNQKVFNTKGGAVSVTTKSDAHSGTMLGKKVLFVDTPGFSDAYESEEQRMTDLGRALYFAQAGVHAIVICFNGTARFDLATEGVVNALDQLGTFWPHAFVLYSHADDMGSTESEQKQQIFQWINNPRCPERLKWLLQQVQYRFMTVESRMRGNDHVYHQQKCKELLDLVEQVYTSNNRQLYTNKLFKWAKEKYDQARQEKKRQEEELKNCQESLREHQELLKSFEEQSMMQQRSHQQAIDNLQDEIKSLQLQQQESNFAQEREELYLQQLQKEETEQEQIRKLNSIIQEQKETMEQIRQTQSMQLREENRLQALQAQSVMEQYMESMREDMRAIKAENKELRDRFMESQKQVQSQPSTKSGDNDLVGAAITGVVTTGVKYIASKCSVM